MEETFICARARIRSRAACARGDGRQLLGGCSRAIWTGPIWIRSGPIWIRVGLDWPDLDSIWTGLARYGFVDSICIGLARSGFDLDLIGPICVRSVPIWIRFGLDWPDMDSIGPDLDSIRIGLARSGFDCVRSEYLRISTLGVRFALFLHGRWLSGRPFWRWSRYW